MYKSLKDVYVKESFARPVPPPYMRYIINESGEGIIYPFEVTSVRTGKDLIELFDDAAKTLGIKHIDFNNALQKEVTVLYTHDHAVTKRLSAWLHELDNPNSEMISLANGRKIRAIGFENYNNIFDKLPLSTTVKDGNDVQVRRAIAGAVFLHAAILMGKILKERMHEEIGHTGGHAGVVIKDLKFKDRKVKLPVKFDIEFNKTKEQDNNDLNGASAFSSQDNNYSNPNDSKTNFAIAPYGSNGGIASPDSAAFDRTI